MQIKIGSTVCSVWVAAVLLTFVECSKPQPYEKYAEGSCLYVRWWGTGGLFNESINEWAATLRYVPVASKYHYYRLASAIPAYTSRSEDAFQREFCYTREAHLSHELGRNTISGFGSVLRDFDVASGDVPAGNRYWANTPRSSDKSDTLRETISDSDGVSFAFMVGCWEKSNERVWKVLSVTPELTPKVRKRILNHIKGLLFKTSNIMFLRYDTCPLINPLLSDVGVVDAPLFENYQFTSLDSPTNLGKKAWKKDSLYKVKKHGVKSNKFGPLTTTTYEPVRSIDKPAYFSEKVSGKGHRKKWSRKGLRKEHALVQN